MERIATAISDVCILKPTVHTDERGELTEVFKMSALVELKIPNLFAAQGNESYSRYLVLRGLHWQEPPQAKLVRVLTGEILDVVVDIRRWSPTFGVAIQRTLISNRPEMIYVPRGCAHGFLVLSREGARVEYFCDTEYVPSGQCGIRWNDPNLRISWSTTHPIICDRDANLPLLKDIARI